MLLEQYLELVLVLADAPQAADLLHGILSEEVYAEEREEQVEKHVYHRARR